MHKVPQEIGRSRDGLLRPYRKICRHGRVVLKRAEELIDAAKPTYSPSSHAAAVYLFSSHAVRLSRNPARLAGRLSQL